MIKPSKRVYINKNLNFGPKEKTNNFPKISRPRGPFFLPKNLNYKIKQKAKFYLLDHDQTIILYHTNDFYSQ